MKNPLFGQALTVGLITLGTVTSTAREVVDRMREKGEKVGLAKLRMFRPFPVEEVRQLASMVDRIGILDRSFTFGATGAAHTEIAASLYGSPHRPMLRDFIAGLGGRDITPQAITHMFESLLNGRGPELEWVGLKRRSEVIGYG